MSVWLSARCSTDHFILPADTCRPGDPQGPSSQFSAFHFCPSDAQTFVLALIFPTRIFDASTRSFVRPCHTCNCQECFGSSSQMGGRLGSHREAVGAGLGGGLGQEEREEKGGKRSFVLVRCFVLVILTLVFRTSPLPFSAPLFGLSSTFALATCHCNATSLQPIHSIRLHVRHGWSKTHTTLRWHFSSTHRPVLLSLLAHSAIALGNFCSLWHPQTSRTLVSYAMQSAMEVRSVNNILTPLPLPLTHHSFRIRSELRLPHQHRGLHPPNRTNCTSRSRRISHHLLHHCRRAKGP